MVKPIHADYVEGLTYRIIEALTMNGITVTHAMRRLITAEVEAQLCLIQDQLYQYAISNLIDLAHDIRPSKARHPRTS